MAPPERTTNARIPAAEPAFGRFPWLRRWFGTRSERFAAKYLRRQGYRILAANIADPAGEIDLLALHGQTLVVVEVRSTARPDPQVAAVTVDARKQRQVAAAAIRFLSKRRLLGINLRFDVLAIAWPPGLPPTVLHLEQAFAPPDRYQFFA